MMNLSRFWCGMMGLEFLLWMSPGCLSGSLGLQDEKQENSAAVVWDWQL
jgi:hypothetical protein